MHPILLKIGPLTVYSYGVMVALGFGLAAYLAARRAASFGMRSEDVLDLVIYLVIGGIAGARLLYVALNAGYFARHPGEVCSITQGGLAFHGGLAADIAVAVFYARARKIPFWNIADLLAPYLALGQAIGRIGCFLNGCCYGIEARRLPWGVAFPGSGVPRHPTQLYASFILLLLFLVLRERQDRRRFGGEVFIAYCGLYAFQRFFVEFLRGDTPRILFGMNLPQVLSLGMFAVSVLLYRWLSSRWKRCRSS